MHKLRGIRESYGLTINELAELSGIAPGTIRDIESGHKTYKIHDGVAKAIADALYEETLNIFQKTELSHLGRPPMTGRPLTPGASDPFKVAAGEVLCLSCCLITRTSSGDCLHCGTPLQLAG